MFVKSYAKLNLFLRIFGKDNGYHLLDSAFAYLDLHDEIAITKSDIFSFNIKGEYCALINKNDNIFLNIIDFFRSQYNIKDQVRIDLIKNIPVGSGLGGGSSNAAQLIRYYNNNYKLNLSFEQLQELSFRFGSDIAFFLQDYSSLVKNRGELHCPLKKFDNINTILIFPNFGLSTKEVFSNFDGNFSAKLDLDLVKNKDMARIISDHGNDLENAAIATNNKLQNIFNIAKSINQGIVKMSGSGSTIFAIYEDGVYNNAYKALKSNLPDCKVIKNKINWHIDS